MLYLSTILRSPVRDSSDVSLGYLYDIAIQPKVGVYSPLLFLVVKKKEHDQPWYIPYEYVATLSREGIVLKNLRSTIPSEQPEGEFVYLEHDILDEQIVDVEGARVVRVNDLKLGVFENAMCVLGIDISFRGILRRLKIEWIDVFNLCKVTLIDWRKAQLVEGALKINTMSKDLIRLHPADLANIVEDLTVKQGSKFVHSLDSKAAAEVLEEMDPQLQKIIIEYLGPERAAGIMQYMSIDETVDLLKMLPRAEASQFISYLQGSKLKKVEKLISYPDNTAGGLMTTEYVAMRPEATVREAVQEVRRLSPQIRSLLYVYVVDANGKFAGAISLRRLLTAEADEQLENLKSSTPLASALRVDSQLDEVVKIMTKYNLYVAAVLDTDNHLVGVVTIDDVMRVLVPNA